MLERGARSSTVRTLQEPAFTVGSLAIIHRASVDPADAGDDTAGGRSPASALAERVFDERVFVEEKRDAVAHEQFVLARKLLRFLGEVSFPRPIGQVADAIAVGHEALS